MLTVSEDDTDDSRQVSVRYDDSSRTYYCFYRRTDYSSADVTLSYDLNERKWLVETYEYKQCLERPLNELFENQKMPFEDQIRSVTEYLDVHFVALAEEQKIKSNVLLDRFYRFSWLRRLRLLRRYASQHTLIEHSSSSPACFYQRTCPPSSNLALERRSAPVKLSRTSENMQTMAVRALAESWYADSIDQQCTLFSTDTASDDRLEIRPVRLPNKPPSIAEIWLNVVRPNRQTYPQQLIVSHPAVEENWKDLAEKFVRLFGGTFQCDIGRTYHLDYKTEVWQLIVARVELAAERSRTSKVTKTKMIFLIDGVAHHVRG